MTVSITFRTTSAGEWTGIGMDLTAAQVDRNFYNIQVKLDELETTRPEPNNIASITTNGMSMTIILDDASEIGPIPLPVLQFHWRGEYQQSMVYDPLDSFVVTGKGLYTVLVGHITPSVFDEDAVDDDNNPLYNKLFGADVGAAAASLDFDLGFCFQGPINNAVSDTLWEMPVPRVMKLLNATSYHAAHLEIAPTTEDQAFSIQVNDIHVGTINFPIGEIWGTIDWDDTADIVMAAGDLLEVRKPADLDATAATLSVVFLGTRDMS